MATELEVYHAQTGRQVGWDSAVDRIPDEEWCKLPIDESALKYDKHGTNVFGTTWEPTIAQVMSVLDDDNVIIDYSCGTGQFTERLLRNCHNPVRALNVDVSPRYMRIAAERFKHDARVALRLLGRDTDGRSFQEIDEVASGLIPEGGADVLTSTNAIHLYPKLSETLGSWRRVLRRGGLALISTGDMSNPRRTISDWRLHDTVATVNKMAYEVVKTEPLFGEYRDKIEDDDLMRAYGNLTDHVYPAVKPIDLYLDALSEAGLKPLHFFEEPVNIGVNDLVDALSPYHEFVLGWVGGSRKIEGTPPTGKAVRDRLFLLRYCAEKLYAGKDHLQCAWTYITCRGG